MSWQYLLNTTTLMIKQCKTTSAIFHKEVAVKKNNI